MGKEVVLQTRAYVNLQFHLPYKKNFEKLLHDFERTPQLISDVQFEHFVIKNHSVVFKLITQKSGLVFYHEYLKPFFEKYHSNYFLFEIVCYSQINGHIYCYHKSNSKNFTNRPTGRFSKLINNFSTNTHLRNASLCRS